MGRSKRNASPWKKIEAKAEEILSAGGQIRKLSDERWRVSSQTVTGKSYVVSFGMNGSACECGYNRKRKGVRCKHIVAVEMHIMSQKESAASSLAGSFWAGWRSDAPMRSAGRARS